MNSILKVHEREDAVVATPEIAKFDLDNTKLLREELTAVSTAPGDKPLLLDMSIVEFLPSATLGALVELGNRCRTNDRGLALIRLKPKVAEMLRLCALDQVLTIHADEQEALASLT